MKKFVSVIAVGLLTAVAAGSTALYITQNNRIANERFISQEEKKQISTNKKEIEKLKAELENSKKDTSNVQKSVDSNTSELDGIKEQVEANSTNIGNLSNSLEESVAAFTEELENKQDVLTFGEGIENNNGVISSSQSNPDNEPFKITKNENFNNYINFTALASILETKGISRNVTNDSSYPTIINFYTPSGGYISIQISSGNIYIADSYNMNISHEELSGLDSIAGENNTLDNYLKIIGNFEYDFEHPQYLNGVVEITDYMDTDLLYFTKDELTQIFIQIEQEND